MIKKLDLESLEQTNQYQWNNLVVVHKKFNGITRSVSLNDREIEFLKLACTEMTYKEIADYMYLSPRTIDGYRDALFEKLGIKNRVGLVLFAIKNGIIKV